MELSIKHALIIAIGIVLVVLIICGSILLGVLNGNQRSKDIQIQCIRAGGSYIGHTCVYPTGVKQ